MQVYLTRSEACKLLKISKSKFYELLSEDGFPEPRCLSPRKKLWVEEELIAWVNAR